jgi:hypothetical protein
MHKQGNHAPQSAIDAASEAKARETRRQPRKTKPDDIHPSLRALPDYPE